MPADDRELTAEYLLEYQQVGIYVKVSAVDPRTGTEVSITGPASAGEAVLGRNAIRKLEYVLGKRKGAQPGDRRPRGLVV